jgi:trk system potassium uptake protein TrkH
MYLGRIGPLTLAFALVQKPFTSNFRYAKEKVLIG